MLIELPVIRPIVQQYTEGAAFLWSRRAALFNAPEMGEIDLGRLDRRLEAHVAGLVASGRAALREAEAQFEDFAEPGEVFVWLVIGLVSGDAMAIGAVLDRAKALPPQGWRGLSGAIAWAGAAALRGHVSKWAAAPDPLSRWLALTAFSHHRVDPGDLLDRFLADEKPLIRARAIRLLGEIGRRDRTSVAICGLEAASDSERFAAARSCLLLGERGRALPVLRELAEGTGEYADQALELAVVGDRGPEMRRWLGRLIRNTIRTESAVAISGAIREPEVLEWLIGKAAEPPLSAAVGRALRAALDFDLDDTDAFVSDPAVLGADFADRDDGPWPVPSRVRAAINAHGGRGTFTNLATLRRTCLAAAIKAPGQVLTEWRYRRNFPAWS
jgi:uncharacterized protein (TIGR02270 family)